MSTIEKTLLEHLPDQHRFVVAFSGGADSLSLLIALKKIGKEPLAVYVDHQIRSDAELQAERQLNEENCKKLNVPLTILTVNKAELQQLKQQLGTEQAARTLRYRLLFAFAKEHHLPLLTAHNADDQMETVLMHLFQGGDPSKLTIREKRERDGVTIMRPLLTITHQQLKAYAQEAGYVWSEDSTNNDVRYLRNSLRHEVVPAILGTFSGAYDALERFCYRSEKLAQMIEFALSAIPQKQKLTRHLFLSVPPYAREELLYRTLDADERISSALIETLRVKLEGEEPVWSFSASGLLFAFRSDELTISEDEVTASFCYDLSDYQTGEPLVLPDGSVFKGEVETPSTDTQLLRIDLAGLSSPLIRSPLGDDEIVLSGGTCKLSKLFGEWGIPREKRESIPVLEEKKGIVAVFAASFGGRDRLALPYKSLAPRQSNVYSVSRRKEA